MKAALLLLALTFVVFLAPLVFVIRSYFRDTTLRVDTSTGRYPPRDRTWR